MLSDPQSITVNSVAQSLPKIETSQRKGVYRKADGTFQLTVSHSPSKDRVRSLYRVDQFFVDANLQQQFADVYVVMDRPITGFTQTQLEQLAAAVMAAVNTTMVGKLFAQES